MRRALLLLLILAVAVLGLRFMPPEWDPRTPLDLATAPQAPDVLTRWKLARLAHDTGACFAALEAAGLRLARIPDRPAGPGCGVENALLLPASLRALPGLPVVTCPLAAAWVLFERHALQPAARARLETEVAAIRHLGTYNCRNVNHAATGRRSQHATANAIDIAGFLLRDGREVRLLRDWDGEDAEAAFLRDVQEGACRFFSAALGPRYNAAHRDHFHLDMGPWRSCR